MKKEFAFSTHFIFGLVALVAVILLSGCPGPKYPNCKTDDQCRVGTGVDAKSGVCVFGKCQECAKDSDCSGGKQCKDYMCVQACMDDKACGPSSHCESGFCKANCVDSTSCAEDQSCNAGRCMAQVTCTEAGDCQAGFRCESGLCVMTDSDVSSLEKQCQRDGKVFFDFNMYDLKSDGTVVLDDLATCLREHPEWKLLVSGHTDERGSTEYNLSLGERRARSVSDYLTRLGIDRSRTQVISYGEEKPADPASNEEAWAKNRRSEISIQ